MDNINRRHFLGSIIGAIAIEQIPFLALPDTAEWQRIILPYRMLFRGNGHTIQAPGVCNISTEVGRCRFIAEQFEATRPLVFDKAILLTENGRVISDCSFSRQVIMNTGDKFDCSLDLVVSGLDTSCVEEMVELFLNRKAK